MGTNTSKINRIREAFESVEAKERILFFQYFYLEFDLGFDLGLIPREKEEKLKEMLANACCVFLCHYGNEFNYSKQDFLKEDTYNLAICQINSEAFHYIYELVKLFRNQITNAILMGEQQML